MQTLAVFASVLLLTAGSALAQSAGNGVSYNGSSGTSGRASGNDVTGFSARTYPGMSAAQANRPPNPNVVLKPKLGGAITDTVKYGPQMVSPFAPAEYGMGEKYLSAPDTRYDLDRESGPAAHRDTGGIKLFSLEF
jgi:hypothetical protein